MVRFWVDPQTVENRTPDDKINADLIMMGHVHSIQVVVDEGRHTSR